MRRILLCSMAGIAALTTAACFIENGDDDASPTPQCTPVTMHDISFQLSGVGAQAHDGTMAAVRYLDGTQILHCATALIPAGGTFLFAGQTGSVSYPRAELILNSSAGPEFTAGSEHYSFQFGVDGTRTGTDCEVPNGWFLDFDYATATESAITWPLGTGCP